VSAWDDGPADSGGSTRIAGLDGLRGLAVLAVVAFHAGLTWARGGFLGVDTFFVLSGFVITRSLLDEDRRRGAVDLARFWSRRLARLLPALLLVVVAVAADAGLRPIDGLRAFRADAVAALLYVSNWHFLARGQGYFATTAAPSLLQHTWSLAVEEQFYLVWPVALTLALRSRRPRATLLTLAAGGAAASAALQVGLALAGVSAARLYFGSDTRAQSLLLGATVACLLAGAPSFRPNERLRSALQWLAATGLGITALLWWVADGQSAWLYRGGFTLAALAAAATIPAVALVPDGIVARTLRVAPLRWLGAISYGVYLWHWPVQLVLTRSATGLHGGALILFRLAVTIALAEASYRLLEVPIRRRKVAPVPRIACFATLSVGLAGFVAAAAVLAAPPLPPRSEISGAVAAPSASLIGAVTATLPSSSPAPGLRPAQTSTVATREVTTTRPPVTAPTTTVPPLTPTYRVAVLGDSVAESIARGLSQVRLQYGLELFDDSILGCGVTPSGKSRLAGVEHDLGSDCVTWEQTWTERLQRDHPQVAVIQLGRHEVLDRERDGHWTNILEADFAAYVSQQVDHSLDVAARAGSAVVLLTAPYYRGGERPDGGQWPENDPARVSRINDILRQAAARHPRVVVVDLGARTNPGGRFAASVAGVPMRQDGVHYTAQACAWFAPWLVPQVRDAAARA